MKEAARRRLEMLIRVRDFGASHDSDFPSGTLGNQMFAEIGSVASELQGHAADQTVGTNAALTGNASKALARAALRDEMHAINVTARAVALDAPGLENKFRLPRSGSDQALLSAARGFEIDAAPLRDQFIKHEMPADFLDSLKEHIEAFAAAVSNSNAGGETRIKATAAIDSEIERSILAMQRLDPIVRNKYRNDAPTLAGWLSASHVQRSARSKRGAPPDEITHETVKVETPGTKPDEPAVPKP